MYLTHYYLHLGFVKWFCSRLLMNISFVNQTYHFNHHRPHTVSSFEAQRIGSIGKSMRGLQTKTGFAEGDHDTRYNQNRFWTNALGQRFSTLETTQTRIIGVEFLIWGDAKWCNSYFGVGWGIQFWFGGTSVQIGREHLLWEIRSNLFGN